MELENQYKDICYYDSKVEINTSGNCEPRNAFFMGKSGMGKSYCFERLLELGKIDTHQGGEMGDQYLKRSSYYEAGIEIQIFDTISIDFLEIDYQRDNDIQDKKEAYHEYKALFEQGFHRIFLFVKYDRVPIMKENIKSTMLQLRKVSKNITLIITQAPFQEKKINLDEFQSITKFYNISQNVIVLGKDFDIAILKTILLKYMWNDQLTQDFSIEGTLFDDKFSNDMSKETKECFQQLQQQIKNVQCSCLGNHNYSCKYYQAPQVQYVKTHTKETVKNLKPIQEVVKQNSYTNYNQIQSYTQNTQQNQFIDKKDSGQAIDRNNQNQQYQQKTTSQTTNIISNTNSENYDSQQNQNYIEIQQSQLMQFNANDYLSIPKALINQIQYKILFTGFRNNYKQNIFNKLQNNKSKNMQKECNFLYNQVNFNIILQNDLVINQQQSNLNQLKQMCQGIHKIYMFIDLTAYDQLTQSINMLNNIDFPINNVTLVLNNANQNIQKREQLKSQYFVVHNIETLDENQLKDIINKDILESQSLDYIKIIAPQNTQQKSQQNGYYQNTYLSTQQKGTINRK